MVPRGDTVLQSGDEVLALVTADAETAVQDLFVADSRAPGRQGRVRERPMDPSSFTCSSPNRQAAPVPAHPTRTMVAMQAAFFDLDKTVIDQGVDRRVRPALPRGGSSPATHRGRALASQLVYLHLGADEQKLAQVRESRCSN